MENTVQALINKLSELDPEKEVFIVSAGYGGNEYTPANEICVVTSKDLSLGESYELVIGS